MASDPPDAADKLTRMFFTDHKKEVTTSALEQWKFYATQFDEAHERLLQSIDVHDDAGRQAAEQDISMFEHNLGLFSNELTAILSMCSPDECVPIERAMAEHQELLTSVRQHNAQRRQEYAQAMPRLAQKSAASEPVAKTTTGDVPYVSKWLVPYYRLHQAELASMKAHMNARAARCLAGSRGDETTYQLNAEYVTELEHNTTSIRRQLIAFIKRNHIDLRISLGRVLDAVTWTLGQPIVDYSAEPEVEAFFNHVYSNEKELTVELVENLIEDIAQVGRTTGFQLKRRAPVDLLLEEEEEGSGPPSKRHKPQTRRE